MIIVCIVEYTTSFTIIIEYINFNIFQWSKWIDSQLDSIIYFRVVL